MIDTSRITSGFDIEFQLGSNWFLTALRGLHERGLLIPPGGIPIIPADATITIDFVDIIFDIPDRDLRVDITIGGLLPITILVSIALSDDGSELILDTSINNLSLTVPFDALSGLAGAPQLIKLAGDDEHEAVIAVLANMDIRSSSQDGDPLPDGEHEDRGASLAATSFLPTNKHVALGVSDTALSRFANDIWHSQLTTDAGEQPFPNEDDENGSWKSVSMSISNGSIIVTLKAKATVDSPFIDIIPDPDITITVKLVPILVNGGLSFELHPSSNVEFGILGSLLAVFVGGLIGFVIGLFTGNPIAGATIGATAGLIALEVVEIVVGNEITKIIQAQIDGQPLAQFYSCKDNIVHLATVTEDGEGLNLGVLDALPTSVPIFSDNPDALHKRSVLITNSYDQITADGGGFAIEGISDTSERYIPEIANITDKTHVADQLASLIYKTDNNTEVELTLEEILERADTDNVPEPLSIFDSTETNINELLQDGKMPIVCLTPVAIRREETIVTAIRFSSGLELTTSETIALQDAGAIILPNLQLIHPENGNPYYRAKADSTTLNNFESLPEF